MRSWIQNKRKCEQTLRLEVFQRENAHQSKQIQCLVINMLKSPKLIYILMADDFPNSWKKA
jgi:hypothetical protein